MNKSKMALPNTNQVSLPTMGIEKNDRQDIAELSLAVKPSPPKRPPLYNVIFLNDDYTPMDFVQDVLIDVFSFDPMSAEAIMLAIHHEGRGVCGTFDKDVAETKRQIVEDLARAEKHPLVVIVERAPSS